MRFQNFHNNDDDDGDGDGDGDGGNIACWLLTPLRNGFVNLLIGGQPV